MSDQLPHDEELRSLYRRLPADEPRAEIDEAILSAARELADAAAREAAAHESSDTHHGHRRRFLARARWMLPLAAAASVILTVTLTRLTPEQPAIAPSELRESSDSPVIDGTAAPQAGGSGEAELAPEALEDAAPTERANAARQRPESAAAAAQAPVEAPTPAAEKPVAKDSAVATAKTARKASDAVAKQKAESSTENLAQLEARRNPEARRVPGVASLRKPIKPAATPERSAPAARAPAPPPTDAAAPAAPPPAAKSSQGAGAAESAVPPDEATAESLRSLGDSGDGAVPAPGAEPAPSAEAAPAPPPVAALGSRDDAESDQERRSRAARMNAFVAESGESETTPKSDWPFGLAPGLDAASACRALAFPLKEPCRYVEGAAVVEPDPAVAVERGEFRGRKVTRITLFAPGGILVKVALRVEGFTTEQILVAPPAR